jgi:hypothetical protein
VICAPITLPDLMTIWRTARIPNIETFVHVSGDAFPGGDLTALPEGPTADQRQANRYHAAAEVEGENGAIARSVLHTVNGYTFAPMAATEAARQVLGGETRSRLPDASGPVRRRLCRDDRRHPHRRRQLARGRDYPEQRLAAAQRRATP